MEAGRARTVQVKEGERLIRAIRFWAEHHPNKESPVLEIMGRSQRYSPSQILSELEKETPTGMLFLRFLQSGSKHFSVEQLIARLERPAEQHRGEAFAAE